MRILITSIALGFLLSCQQGPNNKTTSPSEQIIIQNPIVNYSLPDPFVTYEDGYYYLFASHQAPDSLYIPIYKSENLADWTFVNGAVAPGDTADWNYKHFWAPEVIKIADTFYLYYTASKKNSPRNQFNRVGVATSKSITGPYEDHGVVIPHGSIDGHPFIDKDGTMYIYFTTEQLNDRDLPMGRIYVHKMKDPFTVEGDPMLMIGQFGWQEGAFIVPKDDKYWMTFSTGRWKDSTYHVNLAHAPTAEGPFTVLQDSLISSSDQVKGPGHNSVFTDKNGKMWLAYHGWDPGLNTRYSRLDSLYWENGTLKCDGPSMTPIIY